ncbi:MAG TPA: homoserine kinase [bacterium]|nr:homoserine kinase [bacterium]
MVRVRVPATTANFGPGFDVIGVALALYNEVEVEPAKSTEVEIAGEGEESLAATSSNLVARAAEEVVRAAHRQTGFHIRCRNRIPLARGLGSSAAAIAGGLVAANTALGNPLPAEEILDLAWKMEGHPDNVAAALFGGVVLVDASEGRIAWTRIIPKWDAVIVVAVPEFSVATMEARTVLPARVPLRDAVSNIGYTAQLVAAMLTGQVDLLRTALDDTLHQPYRRALVPGMDGVFEAARNAGAYGAVLSGSGPSILAVAPEARAHGVGQAMVDAFARAGKRAKHMVMPVDESGAVASQT